MRVRCKDASQSDGLLTAGEVYRVERFFSDGGCCYFELAGIASNFDAGRFDGAGADLDSIFPDEPPPLADESDPVPVRFSEVATDERAAGIARAVANLSSHEYRLGASRYQP